MAKIIFFLFIIFIVSCEKIYNDNDSVKSSDTVFRDCYVNFESNSYYGLEKFTVFVKNISNPIYYYGFEISHEQDTSEQKFSDQFRLQKAEIYLYNSKQMSPIGLSAIVPGESECVYKTEGKVDFTGGVHGDEKLIEVIFFIDGVRLNIADLSENFFLKPCDEFSYVQKTTMHETLYDSDIIKSDHPAEAIHFKKTIFRNSGYETNNRLVWQKNSIIKIAYMSLVSISTDMAEYCQSDKGVITKLDRQGGYKLEELNDNAHFWNETNGTSATVKSEFSIRNDSSTQFVWDIEMYSKYYRDIVSNNPISTIKGDEWFGKTTIIFNIQ